MIRIWLETKFFNLDKDLLGYINWDHSLMKSHGWWIYRKTVITRKTCWSLFQEIYHFIFKKMKGFVILIRNCSYFSKRTCDCGMLLEINEDIIRDKFLPLDNDILGCKNWDHYLMNLAVILSQWILFLDMSFGLYWRIKGNL